MDVRPVAKSFGSHAIGPGILTQRGRSDIRCVRPLAYGGGIVSIGLGAPHGCVVVIRNNLVRQVGVGQSRYGLKSRNEIHVTSDNREQFVGPAAVGKVSRRVRIYADQLRVGETVGPELRTDIVRGQDILPDLDVGDIEPVLVREKRGGVRVFGIGDRIVGALPDGIGQRRSPPQAGEAEENQKDYRDPSFKRPKFARGGGYDARSRLFPPCFVAGGASRAREERDTRSCPHAEFTTRPPARATSSAPPTKAIEFRGTVHELMLKRAHVHTLSCSPLVDGFRRLP